MRLRFNPQPDITAYELALIYKHLVVAGQVSLKYCRIYCDKKEYEEIRELGIARHFEIIEDTNE